MAKNYVENLSEEIRKGMTKKAKDGAFPSVAPTGYLNVPDKSIGITPDPKLGPIVRSLFEKAAGGTQSAQELTRWAKLNGLRSKKGAVLAKDTICANILRNPVYAGTFRWGGKIYEGKYEPLVSKATFDRVQRALDGRSRAKGRVHEFAYAGLVKCGTCGGLMSGDLKKGRYVYYRCAGTKGCKRFYPERVLEDETLRLLSSLQIDEAVSEWLLAELEKLHDQGMDEAALKRLVSRRKALQGLQARAYEDKLLGKIDEAFWAERNAAWQTELAEINWELLSIENAPPKADLLAAARKPVELLQVAPTLYVTQDPAEKARLLKTIVSNYTITDGSVSVVLRSPFDVLARGAKTGKWWS
jgi:site-specific DNA recombinase